MNHVTLSNQLPSVMVGIMGSLNRRITHVESRVPRSPNEGGGGVVGG